MSDYKLVEKPSDKRNLFKVTIVGDSNDGDYMTEVDYFSEEDFDKYVIKALTDLRDNYGGDQQLENYQNKYDLSIPYNGYDGHCHTLEELTVEYMDENGKVWDVKF